MRKVRYVGSSTKLHRTDEGYHVYLLRGRDGFITREYDGSTITAEFLPETGPGCPVRMEGTMSVDLPHHVVLTRDEFDYIDPPVVEVDADEYLALKKDAERWRFFANSMPTALMLGYTAPGGINTLSSDWKAECDRLADARMTHEKLVMSADGG